MRGQRWPWLLSATLLFAAGAAAAWSTYLHWMPCRGSMLSGSVLRGYQYGPDFSDACLRRMDGGLPFPYPPEPAEQAPWASELGVTAMVLAGLAWLVPVLVLRWSVPLRMVVALPGLATSLVASMAVGALKDPARTPDSYISSWHWALIDVSALAVAFVVLVTAWAHRTPILGLRLIVLLWGTTAFGLLRGMAEYISMGTFSDANWDVPPGTGYLTAAGLVIAALLTMILTLTGGRPSEPVSSSAQLTAVR